MDDQGCGMFFVYLLVMGLFIAGSVVVLAVLSAGFSAVFG